MSDLTNTPKVRTPAYAASAERFNAERELGRRVVEIMTAPGYGNHRDRAIDVVWLIERKARSLGLLPEASP